MDEGFGQPPDHFEPEVLPKTHRARVARYDKIELHRREAALTRSDKRVAAHGPRHTTPA